jgi:predicted RNA methylase
MNEIEEGAIWHEVECGYYAADLVLWEELVPAGSTLVDLGCGTGRVATHLARRDRTVTAVDADPRVLDVLDQRSTARALGIECVCADVKDFNLRRRFDAVIAPMQLVQLLRGIEERRAMLRRAMRHMRPGALFAATLMDLDDEPIGDEYYPPPPDMLEVDGSVYSSQSVAVRPIDDGGAIAIDRVRTVVAPNGGQKKSVARVRLELLEPEVFEQEMEAVGMTIEERRIIPPTQEHVGSIVVVGRAPRKD